MKVKLRTLKQEKYEIDIDASETVSHLKDLIEERYSIAKSWQILIFSGKILDNDKTIETYKIEEKDFLVLMVKKPAEEASAEKKPVSSAAPTPAPQPAQTQAPTPQPAQTPQTQPQPTPQVQPPVQPTQPTQPQPSVPAQRQPQPASHVPIDESAVANLCEVGFPRDQVEVALRAAFGNADRAYDYLLNGIPEGVLQPQPPQPPAQLPSQPAPQPASQPASQPNPNPANQPAQRSGVFDALKSHPQFQQLCMLAQNGGEDALKQILTYFQETNPQLVRLIAENKNEFIELLNTPIPAQQGGRAGAGAGAGIGGNLRGLGGGAGATPGVIRVQVTPQDEVAINNLVGMGFDRNRVLEAYFLFERDSAMTAEYLLNNPQDDTMVDGGDGGEGGDGGDGGIYDEEEDEFDDVGEY